MDKIEVISGKFLFSDNLHQSYIIPELRKINERMTAGTLEYKDGAWIEKEA